MYTLLVALLLVNNILLSCTGIMRNEIQEVIRNAYLAEKTNIIRMEGEE